VRWTVITNLASLVTLTMHSYATFRMRGSSPDAGATLPLMLGNVGLVIAGVLLLARGKTAGLLVSLAGIVAQILMLCTLGDRAAIMLVLLAPGLVLAALSVVVYAAPIWRFLRGR
jgi:hypothetical protein